MNEIIGPEGNEEVEFETESLTPHNSAGFISEAFNCNEVDERCVLHSFFGDNVLEVRFVYAIRYLPIEEAKELLYALI